MFTLKIKMNLEPLSKLRRAWISGLSGGSGAMRDALEKASGIYMQSMYERFNRYSSGGGDWTPLKPSTISRKGHDAILIDTYTLRNALDPRSMVSSGLVSAGRSGYRIGIQDGIPHPRSKLSVSQLASVHQQGLGRVPARAIIVEPSWTTKHKMAKAMEVGLKQVLRETVE